ncbi:MAG: hypothetical protein KF708_22465 [Pirellulales bacterium]|nr:hypothetical protein [Pirellulales bacterium]
MARPKRPVFKVSTAKTLVKVAKEYRSRAHGGYRAEIPAMDWFNEEPQPFQITSTGEGSGSGATLEGRLMKKVDGSWEPTGDPKPLVDLYQASRQVGDVVFCILQQGDQLVIDTPSTAPRWFKGQLADSLGVGSSSGGGESASVSGVVALDGGPVPEITSVINYLSLAGPSGANVLIVEDRSGDEPAYLLANVGHVAIEVVVDVDTDDPDDPTALRKHTRTVVTMAGDDDTANTDIIELDECS